MTQIGIREIVVLLRMYKMATTNKRYKTWFLTTLGQLPLFLLNYKFGPTGCLSVNAAIIDHIRHGVSLALPYHNYIVAFIPQDTMQCSIPNPHTLLCFMITPTPKGILGWSNEPSHDI